MVSKVGHEPLGISLAISQQRRVVQMRKGIQCAQRKRIATEADFAALFERERLCRRTISPSYSSNSFITAGTGNSSPTFWYASLTMLAVLSCRTRGPE